MRVRMCAACACAVRTGKQAAVTVPFHCVQHAKGIKWSLSCPLYGRILEDYQGCHKDTRASRPRPMASITGPSRFKTFLPISEGVASTCWQGGKVCKHCTVTGNFTRSAVLQPGAVRCVRRFRLDAGTSLTQPWLRQIKPTVLQYPRVQRASVQGVAADAVRVRVVRPIFRRWQLAGVRSWVLRRK